MEIGQFKKSVQEIAKIVGHMVEEKLGDRSQMEEQVRNVAKQVEKMVGEALGNRRMEFGKVKMKFKKLEHFKGDLPAYATPGAAGLDVRASIDEDMVLAPGARCMVPTGLSVEIPHGYEIQVRPRSGLAIMKGLGIVNSPGTIDSDYRGEIKIILINLGQEPITIVDQERIAQLVVAPVIHAQVEEATDLEESQRGDGGFGSTGV